MSRSGSDEVKRMPLSVEPQPTMPPGQGLAAAGTHGLVGRILSPTLYDWPEVSGAVRALVETLQKRLDHHGITATWNAEADTSAVGHDPLLAPDLILAQTCGRPFVTLLSDGVQVVGTPIYSVEGCHGADYRSAIVVRAADQARSLADLAHRVAAINSPCSQSGLVALAHTFATAPSGTVPPGEILQTGGHRQSMAAVADGRADVAAIDAVCWALARRHMPEIVAGLRVLHWSAPAPGLPFVTSRSRPGADVARIQQALAATLSDPNLSAARDALFLSAVTSPDALPDYGRIAAMAETIRSIQPGVWPLD